jgi:glutamine synthetase
MTPSPAPGHHHQTTLPARKLERILGKPCTAWTAGDLVDVVKSHGLRLVSLMHVGSDGWLKTLDFVPRSEEHLRDVMEGGERADGSSILPGTGIRAGASDILLRPRLSSAFLNPFSEVPGLILMASHAGRDGNPLPQSPDTIVRAAYQRLKTELNVDLHALGEVEYFLGRRATEEDMYGSNDRGYHASSPFVFGEGLRREALTLLAEIGVPIKYGHSEVGYIPATESDDIIWEQHEVEMALAPLPDAADAVVLTQWVLRNLARRQGMRCSFHPIVRQGHAGNGLHFHFSPMVDGKHVGGRGPDGQFSAAAQWLIAGLTRYGGALMAFGNRTEESFIRLLQAKEAPSAVAWGEYDRNALVRIPIVAKAPDGRFISPPTIEFRLPDGSAHPHLLVAGVAQVMAAGKAIPEIAQVLERTAAPRVREDPSAASRLPKEHSEVGDALAAHRSYLEAGEVFPPALVDTVVNSLRTCPSCGRSL